MAKADRDSEPHQIRLRAAWKHVSIGVRVDLPVDWPLDLHSPFQISRRFNRPALDPARETISLRLEAVPGLLHATLNDEIILSQSQSRPEATDVESRAGRLLQIPITLAPKNSLILTIDPTGWSSHPQLARGWGIVSLSIETITPESRSVP